MNNKILTLLGISLLLLALGLIALPFTDPDAEIINKDGTTELLNK